MNCLRGLIACSILLILCSCASYQHNGMSVEAQKACTQQCLMRMASCEQKCVNNCRLCSKKSLKIASSRYMDYLHEEIIQGGYINRDLKSYRDPLKCRKVTCNCPADFSVCNQGCIGVIEKRLQPVKYCI